MRPRRLLVMLAVVLALVATACGGGGGDKKIDGQILATPFDLLAGGTDTLGAHLGTPLVVNFFASWCAPCVAEMPALEEVHQQYAGRVQFLGMDYQEPMTDGMKIVEKSKITYPAGHDPEGLFLQGLGGGLGMPTTVLIRANGTIAATHTGALTADALRAMLDKAFP